MLCFLGGNTCFVHFFGLAGNIVEHFADGGNAFLAAKLAVAGNKQGVLVEGGKFLERGAPSG